MPFNLKVTLVSVVVAAAVLTLLLLKRRRKRRKFIQAHMKHPTGFIKYHPDTLTRVKKSIEEKTDDESKAVAAFNFKGDIRASGRHTLSHVIDEIILNKERFSEVVATVESPGGSVTEYGHVYGEMCRIPQSGLKLTVCIDSVAASGGYLMSLPANQIVAAPFAMVGSIGVVSFVPNVRRLLEKFLIEPRTFTAGDYKRTVTLTDDASPEDVAHYQKQLELIHEQFKLALLKHRPQVDVARVATGDHWLASSSVEKDLKLVDRIAVSSDYLLELNRRQDICEFSEEKKRRGISQLLSLMSLAFRSIDELFALR